MGFPVFPNICSGLLPMIIINIAVSLTSMKHTLNSFLRALGLANQLPHALHDATHIVFPEEYGLSSDLALSGLSEEVVKALPLTVYEPNTLNLADMECPVCLCEFQRGQELRLLPLCKHVYHRHCLDKWLDHQRTTCPLCRASLVPEDIAKRQQKREQQLSEEIMFLFSSFHGASLWCYV
ncbi:hypothetical protein GOP47_0019172 [Adiantum capillus-veneris]|uniref:RING-type domain-containing protein n=1 Tax=Adiantum capillus-veneris TaxID=13818 RepID=A0A9D4Z8U5_ADICA|nr:hypothetical protein GOP47_0019172 [Adiantum capillus-veneris]